MASKLFLAAFSATLLVPSTAAAFEYVSVGVGVIGHAGAVFLDDFDGAEDQIGGRDVEPGYPGFAGLATGVGPMFDVRFLEYVGIEFDVMITTDRGKADIDLKDPVNKTTYNIEIEQPAVHLPLLIKGSYPSEIVRPCGFIGPEFVVPTGDPEVVIDPASGAPLPKRWGVAEADTYTMLTFGLGVEFVIPQPLEVVSFRIPIQLRLSVNPGVGENREERSTNLQTTPGSPTDTLTQEDFVTEWQYQAVASFGASAHF